MNNVTPLTTITSRYTRIGYHDDFILRQVLSQEKKKYERTLSHFRNTCCLSTMINTLRNKKKKKERWLKKKKKIFTIYRSLSFAVPGRKATETLFVARQMENRGSLASSSPTLSVLPSLLLPPPPSTPPLRYRFLSPYYVMEPYYIDASVRRETKKRNIKKTNTPTPLGGPKPRPTL